MKRSRNSNEHALAVQKPAPEKAESPVVAAKKKTRKQLIDEVVKTACKVTGTQRLDAADRFIVQVPRSCVAEAEGRRCPPGSGLRPDGGDGTPERNRSHACHANDRSQRRGSYVPEAGNVG